MTNNSDGLDAALSSLGAAANLDLTKPLRTTALLMDQETRNTFRTEADPWGHPWPPHAESTKQSRLRSGNTRTSLLVDTGKMFDGIEHSSDADSATVTIPGPAEVHQYGTTTAGRGHSVTIPARPMFPERVPGGADLPPGYLDRITAPLVAAFTRALA